MTSRGSTGIRLDFVVLPENELRQKVTEDVGPGLGQVRRGDHRHLRHPDLGSEQMARSPWSRSSRGMTQSERDAYARDDLLPTIRGRAFVRKTRSTRCPSTARAA